MHFIWDIFQSAATNVRCARFSVTKQQESGNGQLCNQRPHILHGFAISPVLELTGFEDNRASNPALGVAGFA